MEISFKKQNVTHCQSILLLAFSLFVPTISANAAEYSIFIQPVQSQEQTRKAFQPLVDYLAAKTGQTYSVKTTLNFVTYWQRMKRGDEFDLVLDAAHFTDYRVKNMGYEILAKLPDTVSFSLVTDESSLFFDSDELIGKSIATAPSPSLGGVRMAQIYPNILRQPVAISTNNFTDALSKVRSKKIVAALVPTPLVNNDRTVNTIMTTEPVPHMALSASGKISKDLKAAIRQALLAASKTPEGQEMLKALNIAEFVATTPEEYDGYATLLEGIWGY